MKKVVLKPGKEKSLLRFHPWIFSGAIAEAPSFSDGDILALYSHEDIFLGTGYFHTKNSIAGRMLSFEKKEIEEVLREKLIAAFALRKSLINMSRTTCFRLVNAEGDGLSGLIIDQYNDIFVIQISTAGMEKLKPLLIKLLVELFIPKGIYEKSTSSSRAQEGLEEYSGILYGEVPREITVMENDIKFLVPLMDGQKTGLFLDQRSMREKIASYSFNKRVLNCFSYTGGFSLFALKGGAKEVVSVDSCKKASSYAEKNTLLNGFDPSIHKVEESDVFTFLKNDPLNFDLIILDPPAFAKKRSDVDNACRGYIDLNQRALKKMPPASLLLTCSCSYFIDTALFQNLISQAAALAKRTVKIVERHTQAIDHPINLFHPEGEYLKSLLLFVD